MSKTTDPDMPLLQVAQPRKTPQVVANAVASYVLAFVQILFWILVAIAACALGWIGLQLIIWVCQLASSALGV